MTQCPTHTPFPILPLRNRETIYTKEANFAVFWRTNSVFEKICHP